MGYGKSKPGMFKMKHQGVPALMKALVGNQDRLPQHLQDAIKAAPEKPAKKAAAKKYGSQVLKKDPTDKKKKTTSGSNSMFPERGTLEERKMREEYKNASDSEKRRLRSEFTSRQLKDYGETSGDEGYNRMRAREKELTQKYTQQFGDPGERGIGKDERISRMDAIRSNVARDVGRADYRTNMNSTDSPEYKQTMSKYRAEQTRLGKIFDLHMQGKEYSRYEKPSVSTAGAKKVKGMGPVRKEETSKYGKKHDRLRKKAGKLQDKAMNYPGQKPVSDKKADKLLDKSRKLKDKARKIRKNANS